MEGEIKDFLTLPRFLTLLSPGLVFVYLQAVIRTGRAPAVTKDNLAAFIGVSSIYTVLMLTLGLFPAVLQKDGTALFSSSSTQRFGVFCFAFFAPAVLGVIYGAAQQREFLYKLMMAARLDPINPSPSAWETLVRRMSQGEYVFVTLKDGKQFTGNLDGGASFSSQDGCYDMVLSETDPPPGQPSDVARSTWIASGEIQTIEILSRRPAERGDEKLFFRPKPPTTGS